VINRPSIKNIFFSKKSVKKKEKLKEYYKKLKIIINKLSVK
jgi:hypothetical protein